MRMLVASSVARSVKGIVGVGLSLYWGAALATGGTTRGATRPKCAQWCVQHVCTILGVYVPMKHIVKAMPPRKGGNNMLEIERALAWAGVRVQGRLLTFAELCEIRVPVIAHTADHFVVVETANGQFVRMLDGRRRRRTLSPRNFGKQWDGKVLVPHPPEPGDIVPAYLGAVPRGRARIRFDTLLREVGRIVSSAPSVDFTFSFRNQGTGALRIKRVRADCACAVADQPSKPIQPGSQGSVTIRYKPAGLKGPFAHRVFVETNDPVFPVVPLVLSGNAAEPLQVVPAKLSLGEVVAGGTATGRVLLRSSGDVPLEILTVKTSRAGVNASAVVVSHDMAKSLVGSAGKLHVAGQTDGTAGAHAISVSVDTTGWALGGAESTIKVGTNLEECRAVEIPLDLRVVKPIATIPAVLFLGVTQPGDTVETTVRAFMKNDEPIHIRSVRSELSDVHCDFPAGPASKADLKFRVKAPSKPGRVDSQVTIEYLPGPNGELAEVSLPVCGYVLAGETGQAR